MGKRLICCSIMQNELERLCKDKNVEINYIDAALHVNPDKLAAALETAMAESDGNDVLVIGNKCHPDMEKIVAGRGRVIAADNCIE